MAESARRYISLLAIAFWLGGLTFYALVVVPTGSDVIGRTEQGFVTRLVTWKLNWIGAAALVLLLGNIVARRNRWLFVSWTMLLLTQLALFWLHPQVDLLLDLESHTVKDSAKFYSIHRVYLWTVTALWLAGIWHCWLLVAGERGTNSSREIAPQRG